MDTAVQTRVRTSSAGSRQLGIETEAVVAGAVAAVVCGGIACLLLLGRLTPLWIAGGSPCSPSGS